MFTPQWSSYTYKASDSAAYTTTTKNCKCTNTRSDGGKRPLRSLDASEWVVGIGVKEGICVTTGEDLWGRIDTTCMHLLYVHKYTRTYMRTMQAGTVLLLVLVIMCKKGSLLFAPIR